MRICTKRLYIFFGNIKRHLANLNSTAVRSFTKMIQSLSSSFNGQLGGGDAVISQTPLSRDVCAALFCAGRSSCFFVFLVPPPLCAVALPPRTPQHLLGGCS